VVEEDLPCKGDECESTRGVEEKREEGTTRKGGEEPGSRPVGADVLVGIPVGSSTGVRFVAETVTLEAGEQNGELERDGPGEEGWR